MLDHGASRYYRKHTFSVMLKVEASQLFDHDVLNCLIVHEKRL